MIDNEPGTPPTHELSNWRRAARTATALGGTATVAVFTMANTGCEAAEGGSDSPGINENFGQPATEAMLEAVKAEITANHGDVLDAEVDAGGVVITCDEGGNQLISTVVRPESDGSYDEELPADVARQC